MTVSVSAPFEQAKRRAHQSHHGALHAALLASLLLLCRQQLVQA